MELSKDDFGKMVSAAVFSSIPSEQKEKLLKDAINYVLNTERRNSYGGLSQTPLMEMFNAGVATAVRDLVAEAISKDDSFNNRVRSLIQRAIEATFAEKREEEMIRDVQYAISKVLTRGE